ncbi:hypothetical protein [Streptomyces sp. NEAU-174]|uniref:hypothetical protein n=1 Tax=Streptomyces sp. NEAU-174 TaxID=3458254 RepID=UPI004044E541
MPTYEALPRFTTDFHQLSLEQRHRFQQVVAQAFVPDLRTGCFRAGLRIQRVQSAPGIWELTWAGDGRATWQYGPEIVRGARHIIWRRIGTHAILAGP